MRYRFNHVKPSPDNCVVPAFVQSVRKKAKRNILDEKGNVIGTEIVQLPVVSPIPHEEFENVGLSCDLFTPENQKAAGVDLRTLPPISTPFFGMTLDQRSEAVEQLENFDYDSLLEKKQASESGVQPINFNE